MRVPVVGLGDSLQWFSDFFFVNRQVGWLIGVYGTIAKTTNGGASWFVQRATVGRNQTNVHFTDSLYGWVVGNQIEMYKTTNGGTTWLDVVPPNQVNTADVYFFNRSEGWLLSDHALHKTTDAGNTWLEVFTSSGSYLRSMHWASDAHGFLTSIRTTCSKPKTVELRGEKLRICKPQASGQ